MLFNTVQFFIFFLLVVIGFVTLRSTPRKVFLLVASYYFYMCWSTQYIWVIWGITILDYFAGLAIERSKTPSARRAFLLLSLASNLGLLIFFKYLDFFLTSTFSFLRMIHVASDAPLLKIILPVGISFHTFQAMAYTIDVYKRKAPAERSFLNYALYVAFFPQMVAGPIERPNQLLPQFHGEPRVTGGKIKSGLARIIWGLFKKVVIADSLALVVNGVYRNSAGMPGQLLLLATVAFSIQIYCDFSGYSDIAVGLARLLGYELTINFRFPYCSSSIPEFWHRWHISLSTWFRDYLYFPLGGNRVPLSRNYFNLMIVFVVSGLWHGANWTYIVWGALHGSYLILSRLTASLRTRALSTFGLDGTSPALSVVRVLWTFSLVTIAWIFFRASSVTQAFDILRRSFHFGTVYSNQIATFGLPRVNALLITFLTILMLAVEWQMAFPSIRMKQLWSKPAVRWSAYYACAYSIIFFGVFSHLEFIYFQF